MALHSKKNFPDSITDASGDHKEILKILRRSIKDILKPYKYCLKGSQNNGGLIIINSNSSVRRIDTKTTLQINGYTLLPIPVKVPTNSGAKSPGVPLKVPGLN